VIGFFRKVLEDLIEEWVGDSVNTGFPGIIMAYDPVTQKADVQCAIKRRRTFETGDLGDARVDLIPSVAVHFPGSAKFEMIWDLEVGDRVWVKCSQDDLDSWLSDGQESPGSSLRRHALKDAVIEPGLRDFGNARLPCPKGTMRIGAVDGPQILFSLTDLVLTVSCFNEVRILGQTKVDIRSDGDVFIQGRWVDPLSTADI